MAVPETKKVPVEKIASALQKTKIPLFRNEDEAKEALGVPEKHIYFVPDDNQIPVRGGVQEECKGCE